MEARRAKGVVRACGRARGQTVKEELDVEGRRDDGEVEHELVQLAKQTRVIDAQHALENIGLREEGEMDDRQEREPMIKWKLRGIGQKISVASWGEGYSGQGISARPRRARQSFLRRSSPA